MLHAFILPIQLRSAPKEPKTIRLWVSQDQGKVWAISAQKTVDTANSYFDFTASTPGEHWFSLQILDPKSEEIPTPSSFPVQLKVRLDFTQTIFKPLQIDLPPSPPPLPLSSDSVRLLEQNQALQKEVQDLKKRLEVLEKHLQTTTPKRP